MSFLNASNLILKLKTVSELLTSGMDFYFLTQMDSTIEHNNLDVVLKMDIITDFSLIIKFLTIQYIILLALDIGALICSIQSRELWVITPKSFSCTDFSRTSSLIE